jgi:RNA polymerase sigma-70 factor (ECF subfamily)
LDAASPHSAEVTGSLSKSGEGGAPGIEIDEFWDAAAGDSIGLTKNELATVLLAVGVKYNYGLAPGSVAAGSQMAAFWRSLQLADLALSHGCVLGRDAAWQKFMTRFRAPLTQGGMGITGSTESGRELADSLYAELFGLSETGEQRRSPLSYYSGRGSLLGFLRATLAQRNVDHHRRASREVAMPAEEPAAVPTASHPTAEILARLGESLKATLGSLEPEERFLLSAGFLDQRTLLDISRVLRVHEATVSRRIQRLTGRLHKELLKNLQASGMSKGAAEEALGTDPRDIETNLRAMLQTSGSSTFYKQR